MDELIKKIPVSIIAICVAVLTVLISFAVIRGDTSIDIWGIKIEPKEISQPTRTTTNFPVGSVIASYLSTQQMRVKFKDEWVLADGRDVSTNTEFYKTTGKTKLPDLRGMFIRGLNYGRNDEYRDPDDKRVVGDYQPDAFQKHQHGIATAGVWGRSFKGENGDPKTAYKADGDTKYTGGEETRAKNVALYYYIKIN
jgi:hypothetical protein